MTRDTAPYGNTLLTYEIIRRGEGYAISITLVGSSLCVTAPKGTRATIIREKVISKGDWIIEKLDRARKFGRTWPRNLVSGESLPYLGRQHMLRVRRAKDVHQPRIILRAGAFELFVPADWDAATTTNSGRIALRAWYRDHLAKRLPDSVAYHASALRLPVPQIRVLNLRGRWGSCLPPGRLNFHWLLATQAPRLIDFVVAHEMCHLQHPDHGKAFQRSLTRLMPDWHLREQALNAGTLIQLG